jgi:sugar phosphate permease
MAFNSANIGVAAVVFGVAVFVAATGPLIFQVLGILIAIMLVNHGLQLMGKPPLFVMVQDWFNSSKR